MSNEITININNSLQNPSSGTTIPLKDSFAPGSLKFTQNTQLMWSEAVTVTTSDTALTFTGVTTAGWVMLLNLDTTNFVSWGPDNSGAIKKIGKLKAGEPACFRIDSSATLRVQADTASCKVLIKVWND